MQTKYRIVGAFFFVGLFLAVVLTLMVDDEGHIFASGYVTSYKVRVKDASSISEGSFVRMAGRKIGRVTGLEFVQSAKGTDKPFEIEVTFKVKKDVKIRSDSEASFKMMSILTGTQLDISPGTPDGEILEENSLVKTSGKGDIIATLTELFSNVGDGGLGRMLLGKESMKNVSTIMVTLAGDAGLGKWIIGEESMAKVAPMVEDIRATVENIRKATSAESKATLARLLHDEELGRNVKETVTDIRESMKGIRKFAADLGEGKGALSMLVSDEETRKRFDNIITSLSDVMTDVRAGESVVSRLISDKKMGDELAQAFTSIATFTKGLAEGEGTLAKLINDPELYVEIKRLIGQTREAIEDAREAAPISAFTSIIFSAVQ